MSRKRATTWLTSAFVALWLPFVAIGSQASALPAQDGYGRTTTTSGEGFNEVCVLTDQSGEPGDTVIAEVSGVAAGTEVRILFNGQEVGRGVAEADGDSTTGTAVISFVVPPVPDGTYTVVATGPTFTEACGGGDGSFQVLNSQVLDEGATKSGAAGGGGLLPRTGIELAMWLAIAAVLVLVGRALLTEARRRRRRARRAQARQHRSTAGV
jgi:hypothetical protein